MKKTDIADKCMYCDYTYGVQSPMGDALLFANTHHNYMLYLFGTQGPEALAKYFEAHGYSGRVDSIPSMVGEVPIYLLTEPEKKHRHAIILGSSNKFFLPVITNYFAERHDIANVFYAVSNRDLTHKILQIPPLPFSFN